MNPNTLNLDELPLDVVERIDNVCVRFEEALQARQHPVLAAYLNEMPEAWKTPLLHEMLRVELEYRIGAGEDPTLEEYLATYPDFSEQLRLVFPPSKASSTSAVDLARAETAHRFVATPSQVANYRIVRELGRGGMGVVYEAIQSPLGRHVALKVLAPKATTGTEVERFRREAEVASRLHHTNIVPIFEAGQAGDVCFYAMQYIQGPDLHQFIGHLRQLRGRDAPVLPATKEDQPKTVVLVKRRVPAALRDLARPALTTGFTGPWSEEELTGSGYYSRVAEIGVQAAGALAYAHAQGVIHRDIKPTNLLLDGRGTVWVTDFGLVKTADSDLTSSGALVGTLRYLAPERLQGACDARSDVYSLGLTLYELAALYPAFADTDHLRLLDAIKSGEPARPRQLDPRVPRDLETIILKAIDKAPTRRYQSAEALAEDLRRFQAGEPILARRTSTLEKVWIWAKRHPLPALGIALIVLALVLVAVMSLWTARQAVQNEENTKKVLNEVEKERDAKDRALQRAEGLRLIAQAEVARAENPALALLLAVEGAARAPGLLANNAMQQAIDQCQELKTLIGHSGSVLSSSFSADGTKVLTCSEDGTASIWDAATGKRLHVLEEPNLARAYFSPDGRRVVTLSGFDGFRRFELAALYWLIGDWQKNGPSVRLWDAESGKPIAHWKPPKPKGVTWFGYSAGAAFSADNRYMVTFFSLSPDGPPVVRDTQTGRQVAILAGQPPVLAVAFSPDNRTIATAAIDQAIRIWEAATGRLLHTMHGHQCCVMNLHYSQDGGRLLTYGMGKKLTSPIETRMDSVFIPDEVAGRVWDTATGKQVAALAWPDGDKTPFVTGGFVPGGQYVVLADGRRGRRLWEAATGKPGPVIEPTRPDLSWSSVVLGPDSLTALYWGLDRTPRILSGPDMVTLRGHEDKVLDAAFRPDGKRMVTASADGTARIWATPVVGFPELARGDVWATPHVTLSPDARRLFVRQHVSPQGLLLDTSTGRELARFDAFPATAVFTEGGREVLVIGPGGNNPNETGKVHILDAVTGRTVGTGNNLAGRFVALSPDKRLVLLSQPDASKANAAGETLSVWDFSRRVKFSELKGLTQRVQEAVFNADGTRLLTTSATHYVMVHVFDTTTGMELAQIRKPGPYFWWGTFLDGGKQILAFHIGDVTFRLHQADSGLELRTCTTRTLQPGQLLGWNFPGPRVRLLQTSPDGRRVMCPSYNNTTLPSTNVVGVWDLAKGGEPAIVLKGHTKEVTLTRYSADGRRILTGAEDRTARLWDAASGKELVVCKGHQAAVTCGGVDASGQRIVTAGPDRTVRVWDVASGSEVARLRWPHGAVEELAFTPDSRRVCIRGRDVTQLWDLDILAVARSRLPRGLTGGEREGYEIPTR